MYLEALHAGKLQTMLKSTFFVVLAISILITGCSKKAAKITTLSTDNNGVKIALSSAPDPPQAGSNTFTVRVTDDATQAPVVNANVTISAYNDLAGGGDRETGRSQGDGTYNAPVKLGIPDKYKIDVQVQRPGHDDADAQFMVEAE